MGRHLPPDYTDRIKRLRQQLGLTQMRLADLMGVSFASINRWENGQSKPNSLAWKKILQAEALGLSAFDESLPAEGTSRKIREIQAEYQIPIEKNGFRFFRLTRGGPGSC